MVSLSSKRFLLFIVLVQTPALLCMDRLSSLSSPVGSPVATVAAESSPSVQAASLSSAAQAQSLPIENALIKALYTHGTLICFPHHVDEKIAQALQMLSSCIALPDLTKTQPTLEDFAAATDIAHWLMSHYDELPTFTNAEQLAASFKQRKIVAFKGITQALSPAETAAHAAYITHASESSLSIVSNNDHSREIYQSTLPFELRSSIPCATLFGQSTDNATNTSENTTKSTAIVCSDQMICFLLRELLITASHPVLQNDPDRPYGTIQKIGIYGITVEFERYNEKSALQEKLFNLIEYYAGYGSIDIIELLAVTHAWRRYDLFKAALQFFMMHLTHMTLSGDVPIPAPGVSWRERASLIGEAALRDFAPHLPYHYFDTLSFYPECAPFLFKCLFIKAQSLDLDDTINWEHIKEAIRNSLIILPSILLGEPQLDTLFIGAGKQAHIFRKLFVQELNARYPLSTLKSYYMKSYPLSNYYAFADCVFKRFNITGNALTITLLNAQDGKQQEKDYTGFALNAQSLENLLSILNKTANSFNSAAKSPATPDSAQKSASDQDTHELFNLLNSKFDEGHITINSSSDRNNHLICSRLSTSTLTLLKVVCIGNYFSTTMVIPLRAQTLYSYPLHENAFLIVEQNSIYIINAIGQKIRILDTCVTGYPLTTTKYLSTTTPPGAPSDSQFAQAAADLTAQAQQSPLLSNKYKKTGVENNCFYALYEDGTLKLWQLQLQGTKLELAAAPCVFNCLSHLASAEQRCEAITHIKPLKSCVAVVYFNKIMLFSNDWPPQLIELGVCPSETTSGKLLSLADYAIEHVVQVNDETIAISDKTDTVYIYNINERKVINRRSWKASQLNGRVEALYASEGCLHILTKNFVTGNLNIESLFIAESASVEDACSQLKVIKNRKADKDKKTLASAARKERALEALPCTTYQQSLGCLQVSETESIVNVYYLNQPGSSANEPNNEPDAQFVIAELYRFYRGRTSGVDDQGKRWISSAHEIRAGKVLGNNHWSPYSIDEREAADENDKTYTCNDFHITPLDSVDGLMRIAFASQNTIKIMTFTAQDLESSRAGTIFGQFDWSKNVIGMAHVKGITCPSLVATAVPATSDDSHLLIVDTEGAYITTLKGKIVHTFEPKQSVSPLTTASNKNSLMEKAAQAACITQSLAQTSASQKTVRAVPHQPLTKMAVDHNLLVIGYADGSLKMWDLHNCAEIAFIRPPSDYSLASNQAAQPLIHLTILDAQAIMAVYNNNLVRIYDRNSTFIEFTLPIGNTQPYCTHQIKKGIIGIGCENGAIHIYDYIRKALIKTIPAKKCCCPVKLHSSHGLLQVIYIDGTGEEWCLPELQ